MNNMESTFKKGTVYQFDHVSQYTEGSVGLQSILKKTTGVLNAVAVDTDQFLESKFSPFDTYIHVLIGKLKIIINDVSESVTAGEFLIIPGHTRNTTQAMQPTKLLQLTIKSGYEQEL
jgi:quercetin dioxygenase-like cupin family protein